MTCALDLLKSVMNYHHAFFCAQLKNSVAFVCDLALEKCHSSFAGETRSSDVEGRVGVVIVCLCVRVLRVCVLSVLSVRVCVCHHILD